MDTQTRKLNVARGKIPPEPYEGSASEIEGKIDETRSRLSGITEALIAELHPSSLVTGLKSDLVAKAKETFSGFNDRAQAKDLAVEAGRFVDRHPFSLAALGIGAGLIYLESRGMLPTASNMADESKIQKDRLKKQLEQKRLEAKRKMHNAKSMAADKIRDTKSGASNTYDELVDRAVDRASAMGSKLKEQKEHGLRLVKKQKESGAELYSKGVEKAKHSLDQNPLAVGAAVLGAGLIAGLLMPSSEVERKTIGPKTKEFKDNLVDRGIRAVNSTLN
ncbi:hypothetical protein N9D31_02215 [Oligoflexaceae bacterium]|nr:hypothetical protein [Oligoflexaceae bacterium]